VYKKHTESAGKAKGRKWVRQTVVLGATIQRTVVIKPNAIFSQVGGDELRQTWSVR